MIDIDFKVRRYISEFSNEADELLAEYDLSRFELAKFQTEFGEPNAENPMYDCYPVNNKNIEFLKEYLGEEPEWDFANKSYFVEAHAI